MKSPGQLLLLAGAKSVLQRDPGKVAGSATELNINVKSGACSALADPSISIYTLMSDLTDARAGKHRDPITESRD